MKTKERKLDQARRLIRDYAGGETVDEFKRLFDQDAAEAFKVLSRDHAGEEPDDDIDRSAYRIKIFFAGLSSKLSPARRLLFLLGLVLVAAGLIEVIGNLGDPEALLPLLLLLSTAIFFFLFTMELVDRVRVRDELEVARSLQSGLLPQRGPDLAQYRFAHSYRTANEVGGDYYDFLPLPDGRIALVIGDASGHGITAGLLMAIANATLKAAVDVDPEPQQVMAVLNRTLCRTGDRRAFMTLFYAILDPASGELDYICAGHPFPVLRRQDGRLEELGQGSLPLGLKSNLRPEGGRTRLEPGDLLVLYSDGIVEAIREDGEAFGFDRLHGLLARAASPQAMHDQVLAEFDRFVGNRPLHDDLTLVVAARDESLPPPPAG